MSTAPNGFTRYPLVPFQIVTWALDVHDPVVVRSVTVMVAPLRLAWFLQGPLASSSRPMLYCPGPPCALV